MIREPTTWTVNQRARVDVVLHRRALRLPCVIREVGYPLGGTRILVEWLTCLLRRFWVGPAEVHADVGPPSPDGA